MFHHAECIHNQSVSIIGGYERQHVLTLNFIPVIATDQGGKVINEQDPAFHIGSDQDIGNGVNQICMQRFTTVHRILRRFTPAAVLA